MFNAHVGSIIQFGSVVVLATFLFNDLFLIFAPLFDRSCNYNAMIEYVTIKKLKG
jgi:hypothetical protein